MRVFLIRHGESIGNARGIHQGQKNNFSLSELGKRQVESLNQKIKDLKIDVIYSSDLRRAKETAEILSKTNGLNVILDERLQERNFGIIGEKKDLIKELNSFLKDQSRRGINPRDATPEGGESDRDHFNRIALFFKDIEKNHKEEDNILIVSHGGTNKVVFGVIGYSPLEAMYKIPQGNTCINELIFEKGNWRVEKINCMDHIIIDPELIKKFEKIRDEPLNVENNRCWEKHIKLKEIFEDLGYKTKYKICSFLWSEQRIPKKIINMIQEDLDYHLYLEVKINGLKLIVDASNDSLLPEYNLWDGKSNCNICVIPKEFINENIEGIIQNQLNKQYSSEQINFIKEVNLFFDSLRNK